MADKTLIGKFHAWRYKIDGHNTLVAYTRSDKPNVGDEINISGYIDTGGEYYMYNEPENWDDVTVEDVKDGPRVDYNKQPIHIPIDIKYYHPGGDLITLLTKNTNDSVLTLTPEDMMTIFNGMGGASGDRVEFDACGSLMGAIIRNAICNPEKAIYHDDSQGNRGVTPDTTVTIDLGEGWLEVAQHDDEPWYREICSGLIQNID